MFTLTFLIIYANDLLFLSIFPVSSGQDRVEQSSEEMTGSEKDQVIVGCNYFTTDTNINLFWYQQLPNKSPTLILNELPFGEGTTEPDFKKRFSATLNSTSKTVPLMIKDVHVSDSAVYYCALRPTVTGSTTTLYTNLPQMKVYNQFLSINLLVIYIDYECIYFLLNIIYSKCTLGCKSFKRSNYL
uniref:Ig-like domain-containing protein n=1 Tax=Cyprinus carpio TaxID=7962 RepID=A0A8C1TEG7_CYPCA